MVDLILRPSSLNKDPRIRWALQLRWHECCGETEYATLCRVSDATAEEIVRAGAPYWLFADPTARPDWKTELDRLEPEAMTPDEMRLEIARLRLENARLKRGDQPPIDPAPPDTGARPEGCADRMNCGYRRLETEPPTNIGVCNNPSCRHAVHSLSATAAETVK